MAYKIIYDGEWVKVRPMMNTKWGKDARDPGCELCRSMTCAPAWYSIKRKVYRCTKCFTPKGFPEKW